MATVFLCRKSTPQAVPMRILLRANNVVWLRDNLTSPRSDRAYEDFAKKNKNVFFSNSTNRALPIGIVSKNEKFFSQKLGPAVPLRILPIGRA